MSLVFIKVIKRKKREKGILMQKLPAAAAAIEYKRLEKKTSYTH